MSYIVHRGLSTHHLPSTEYRVQSTEYSKRIFAILQWFQKFRTRYLLACFTLVFLSMASYSTSFSQIFNSNCEFVNPVDSTGLLIRDFRYNPDENFPNWSYTPFYLYGKYRYDSTVGNKIDIFLNDEFLNTYTGDVALVGGIDLTNLTGIDTKSMREYAKEKYRKDVLEEWLKTIEPAPAGCHSGRNTFTISFITKKDCYETRQCRVRLGELICCSNASDVTTFQGLPEGVQTITIGFDTWLIFTRTVACGTYTCCEERYHYTCNPNDPDPNSTWVFSHKSSSSYPGTQCSNTYNSNFQCQIPNPSTCKGCGD